MAWHVRSSRVAEGRVNPHSGKCKRVRYIRSLGIAHRPERGISDGVAAAWVNPSEALSGFPMATKPVVASRLRALRSHRPEITQEVLAEAIGRSTNAVHKWESGKSQPRAEDLAAIAAVYGCSVDYLVGKSDFLSGLAPDQYLVDEDALDAMRRDPDRELRPLVKVPRRVRVIDHAEAQRLIREFRLKDV